MEKILKGRMYYIDLEATEYFMEYLMMKEMDELKDIKWHKSVVRNGKYNDGKLIDDMFSISYGFNVGVDNHNYKMFSENEIHELYERREFFDENVYN